MKTLRYLLLVALALTTIAAQQRRPGGAQTGGGEGGPQGPQDPMSAGNFAALRLRLVGPAMISGRVSGIAVHPTDKSTYYVATASGGLWKTTNAGTVFTPIFDREGSYSIGVVVIDPKNPSTVWVGTGENNSQRSVAYGDGVYRSDDAGQTWRNVGLKTSAHIGRIAIDPRDSKTVYVAAQGLLWGPGGERGLFKTTDGGKTWKNILSVSENTGVTDVVLDPRNPDNIIAASWQRRRHVWTLINGGPESGLHRSTDGGLTWTKIGGGLPREELGRIGLAVSPVDPKVMYAVVEAANRRSGIYRSSDSGVSWERQSDYEGQPMYYAHVVADPVSVDRIYVMDVQLKVSDDAGRTLRNLGERNKHVDNHEIWIDPTDNNHYLVGCDGGLYESFDRGRMWNYKANLPLGQFYDVAVDNAAPFYNVYGGTQDNGSVGGPARTKSVHGITNSDWFVTAGGDGFHTRVDPEDPYTIYAESQGGVLSRFDRRTGQNINIRPQPGKGEPPLRWDWDAPLIVSQHSHTRLYFAANKLFRSDDRGDSWKAVSGDLTRNIDRNSLPVFGKIWGPDAVAKNVSTTVYSNCTTISESAKKDGILYVGTDDGLIQVTENGGGAWRKLETFPGVPERTYVSRVLASQHDAGTVYAGFDNHKTNDFAPYLLKSTDFGKNWTSIKGDLPANGPVLAIAEDHVNKDLLFAGTEFGLFFTADGGQKWIKLSGGFPTISVRDLAIQKRENDLVVGTFGRGIYVLDDYSVLRTAKKETFEQESVLYSVKDALSYIPTRQFGGRGKASQGEAFFTADNPPFGAVFTYYLKDGLQTKRDKRRAAEREAARNKGEVRYPTNEELRAEAEEEAPTILLTVSDAAGKTVRSISAPGSRGFHRVAWDLRYPAPTTQAPRFFDEEPDAAPVGEPSGHLAPPGKYKVAMSRRVDGVVSAMPGSQNFSIIAEDNAADRVALAEFQDKAAALQRAVTGALSAANAAKTEFEAIKRALDMTPAASNKLKDDARAMERRLDDILRAMRGDTTVRRLGEETPMSISERVGDATSGGRGSTARATKTNQESYRIAAEEFAAELPKLRKLLEEDLKALEKAMEAAGAPWTPGRLPDWRPR